MTDHRTGTREEWLTARLELLEAEKELTRRGDELARRRQELPWVRVDKHYRFETDEGTASLADDGHAAITGGRQGRTAGRVGGQLRHGLADVRAGTPWNQHVRARGRRAVRGPGER